jgi:hypothetical protein
MPRTPFRIRRPHQQTSKSSASDSIASSLDVYSEGDGLHSSARSDSDSDSGDSEATLEDVDVYRFGHPLERMFRLDSTDESSIFRSTVSSPTCSSVSSSSAVSSSFYDMCVRASPITLD